MEEGTMEAPRGLLDRVRAKPFALLVIALAFVYLGIGLLGVSAALGISLIGGFGLILLAFTIIFLLSSAGTLMVRRWGLIVGLVMTIVFVLFFSFTVADAFTNPAYPGGWFVVSALPISVLAIILTLYSLLRWKAGVAKTRHLASPYSASGLLTLGVLGFVIAAMILVTAASPLISGLVSRGGQGADVRIVPGAMSAAVPFSPGNLTRPVNSTVTWYNGDTTTHTVTSDTGVFASPYLTPGASFSFKFTQRGTFPYHCEPHPSMTGTIVIT